MTYKILKISFPVLLIIIILTIGYNSYQKANKNTSNPLTVIPTNAAAIIKFNSTDKLYATLNNTEIWQKICDINILENINNQIFNISNFYKENYHLLNNSLFISFHKIGMNNSSLLFASNFKKNDINNLNPLLGKLISETKYNKQIIYQFKYKDNMLFVSYKNDIIFMAQDKMLIEDAIRSSEADENLTTNHYFNTITNTLSESAEIHLFYNYNAIFEFTNLFLEKPINTNDFSEWTAMDVNIKEERLSANGFNAIDSTVQNFTDILKDQNTSKIDIINIIPKNTSLLFTIGFKNPKKLFNKKNKILEKQNKFWSWNKHKKLINSTYKLDYNEFINELENEAGIFNISTNLNKEQKYIFFKSKNSISASSLMQGLITNKKTYGEYSINTTADPNICKQLFGEIFNQKTPYFVIIEDYFIFSSTSSALEYLIDNQNNKNNLAYSVDFKKYKNHFSPKSNLFFYINPGKIANTLKNKLKKDIKKKIVFNSDSIRKFTGLSLQMTTKKDLILNNINLLYDKEFQSTIKEEWLRHLDTSISMKPQLVYNHFTKDKIILIQNDANKIFAINVKGELIWSRQIYSKIIGNVSVLDYYKNKKYQYLFNTNKELYLIDRNGNNVEGFPKKLKHETNIGHALFDYNQTKKYRILIVGTDQNIYNLNQYGNTVKGWKYNKTNTTTTTNTPRHFKVGTNDYILNECNSSSIELLAINGSKRVLFDKDIKFNGKPLQIDNKGNLYAISSEGVLWKGTINGSSSQNKLPHLAATSLLAIQKTTNQEQFVYTNKNALFIVNLKSEEIRSINFEQEIKSLTINSKNIIITTSDKLYILESNKIKKGFPINSDGYFNIADIDNNGQPNLLNIRNGFIYNYQF